MWLERCRDWLRSVGISEALMKCHEHSAGSMAHYAKACTDIMFQYPFGWQVEKALKGSVIMGRN